MHDAYFAGYFDADGCVGITRRRAKNPHGWNYRLNVQVTSIDTNSLHAFERRFGGSVRFDGRRRPRGRDVYTWRAVARDAEAFLLAVGPLLIVKRDRVELAIAFRALCAGENVLPRRWLDRPAVRAKCERVLDDRRACYERMLALNARGIA